MGPRATKNLRLIAEPPIKNWELFLVGPKLQNLKRQVAGRFGGRAKLILEPTLFCRDLVAHGGDVPIGEVSGVLSRHRRAQQPPNERQLACLPQSEVDSAIGASAPCNLDA